MKVRIYMRIGKDEKTKKIYVDASTKQKTDPLRTSANRYSSSVPTIYMIQELTIPDEAFRPATISASISVPIEKLGTAVEVIDPLRIL
jgi:hypothetical protein